MLWSIPLIAAIVSILNYLGGRNARKLTLVQLREKGHAYLKDLSDIEDCHDAAVKRERDCFKDAVAVRKDIPTVHVFGAVGEFSGELSHEDYLKLQITKMIKVRDAKRKDLQEKLNHIKIQMDAISWWWFL